MFVRVIECGKNEGMRLLEPELINLLEIFLRHSCRDQGNRLYSIGRLLATQITINENKIPNVAACIVLNNLYDPLDRAIKNIFGEDFDWRNKECVGLGYAKDTLCPNNWDSYKPWFLTYEEAKSPAAYNFMWAVLPFGRSEDLGRFLFKEIWSNDEYDHIVNYFLGNKDYEMICTFLDKLSELPCRYLEQFLLVPLPIGMSMRPERYLISNLLDTQSVSPNKEINMVCALALWLRCLGVARKNTKWNWDWSDKFQLNFESFLFIVGVYKKFGQSIHFSIYPGGQVDPTAEFLYFSRQFFEPKDYWANDYEAYCQTLFDLINSRLEICSGHINCMGATELRTRLAGYMNQKGSELAAKKSPSVADYYSYYVDVRDGINAILRENSIGEIPD
jgi:hypothetical protein